jgi:hypothetical protein
MPRRPKAIFTAWRSRLCIQGGVDSQPCNFAIATIEPVKVIEPTKTDTTIDTSATGSGCIESNRFQSCSQGHK